MTTAITAARGGLEAGARNTLHRVALQTMVGEFAENDFILKTRIVDTPLVSAHLLAQLNRHEVVRNLECCDNLSVVRRILAGCDADQPHWRYENQQAHRVQQYRDGVQRIDRRIKCIQILQALEDSPDGFQDELRSLQLLRDKYRLVLDYIRPVVKGTLHPGGSASNSSSNNNHHNNHNSTGPLFDGWRLRGIYMRIAGPRKATKAGAWRRSAGAVSINSYDYVVGEECNLQIPGRTGTFGLTVRLVWGMWEDLPNRKAVFHDGVKSFALVDRYSRILI